MWTADSSGRLKQRRKVRTFLCKLGFALQPGELHKQVENAKTEIAKPFAREVELEEKCKRIAELNAELNMDRHENEIVDGTDEQSEDERDKNNRIRSDRNDR